MEEDALENSDSDATELYEILANMSGPEEEIEMNFGARDGTTNLTP